MAHVIAADLQKKFEAWINSNPPEFANVLFEWREYDASTEQVFIFAEGDWNEETRKIVQDFFKEEDKRILVSRVYYS